MLKKPLKTAPHVDSSFEMTRMKLVRSLDFVIMHVLFVEKYDDCLHLGI